MVRVQGGAQQGTGARGEQYLEAAPFQTTLHTETAGADRFGLGENV
jgi:hypothetical protein